MSKVALVGLGETPEIFRLLKGLRDIEVYVCSEDSILPDADIVVFCDCKVSQVDRIPAFSVGVVSSQNTEVLELLRKSGTMAVVCGLSGRDTLTLSSRGQRSSVVALLRSVKTLSGRVIEPCEYPVSMGRNVKDYSLLAFCAVLIVCGQEDYLI
ncbi:MAG: hypothetical protein Q4B04_04585 [bacterium]|nr:hypothetical protein [bacterium]